MKRIDRTSINVAGYKNDGSVFIDRYIVFFKDVDYYDDLPDACKCSEIEIAFYRFKERQKHDKKVDKIINNLYSKIKYR